VDDVLLGRYPFSADMLKSLELIGFKSFADKTRFEFDKGISAVVGPNGSGKSNVVDALKWVLGAQSPKSLRGQEMADVIFNGSQTRRSLGMAEVTLVFDNQSGLLGIESEEVAITRRVYRGGDGEYLINRQIVRLRDIRELFAGTGVTTEAYGVIEQGKVDILLQSSNRDRRLVFEEAAGISRFKMRRDESIRKLHQAEQNLLRANDVVSEVERQLRNVRQQSSRARRHQQWNTRLRSLRLSLGLKDYLESFHDLAVVRQEKETMLQEQHRKNDQVVQLEQQVQEVEQTLAQLEQQRTVVTKTLGEQRRQMDADVSKCENFRLRVDEWNNDLTRLRALWLEAIQSIQDLQNRQDIAQESLRNNQSELSLQSEEVTRCETEYETHMSRVGKQRELLEQERIELMDLIRKSTVLSNDSAGYEAKQSNYNQGCDRLRHRQEQTEQRLVGLQTQAGQLENFRLQSEGKVDKLQSRWDEGRQRIKEQMQKRDQVQEELSQLRQQCAAATERANVLRDLQNAQEGITQGAQEAFTLSQRSDPGPWRYFRGIVADLMEVDMEYAPLIEVALGEYSSFLVFDSMEDSRQLLLDIASDVTNRVGIVTDDTYYQEVPNTPETQQEKDRVVFLKTSSEDTADSWDAVPPCLEGMIRADEHVQVTSELRGLVDVLLSKTWIVPDLPCAIRLYQETKAHNFRFVTHNGEMIDGNGNVQVGVGNNGMGPIVRNSELREMGARITLLESQIETQSIIYQRQQNDIAECESTQRTLQNDLDRERENLALRKVDQEQTNHKIDQLQEQYDISLLELGQMEESLRDLEQDAKVTKEEFQQVQRDVEKQQAKIKQLEASVLSDDQQRQQFERHVTQVKIRRAKKSERIETLRQDIARMNGQRTQFRERQGRLQEQITDSQNRVTAAVRAILKSESQLAIVYLAWEKGKKQLEECSFEYDELHSRRKGMYSELACLRETIHACEENVHKKDLLVEQLSQQMKTLDDRMGEYYGVDLNRLARQASEVEENVQNAPLVLLRWTSENKETGRGDFDSTEHGNIEKLFDVTDDQVYQEMEKEIDKIQASMSSLGPVNLESLQELESLEERLETLKKQHVDLSEAKACQEEILRKIAAESRRLFASTLDAVREHFQDLFRKLFGGGRAEIVLEDEDNILESGIEIIARPPGKEPRSISQLSGGEKTLTALAILLAIFRSRPSPFCVFDEVDAALDESNIDRLMNVLEEFRQDTQFVIITHSKRTMTNAGVLYGVTMQESGVSTRVAVRFEDVREDGNFSVPDSESTVTGENNETDLDEDFTSRHRKTPHWNRNVVSPSQANVDSRRELDPDTDDEVRQ